MSMRRVAAVLAVIAAVLASTAPAQASQSMWVQRDWSASVYSDQVAIQTAQGPFDILQIEGQKGTSVVRTTDGPVTVGKPGQFLWLAHTYNDPQYGLLVTKQIRCTQPVPRARFAMVAGALSRATLTLQCVGEVRELVPTEWAYEEIITGTVPMTAEVAWTGYGPRTVSAGYDGDSRTVTREAFADVTVTVDGEEVYSARMEGVLTTFQIVTHNVG